MRRLILLIALAGAPAYAQSPAPVWTVTCSEGGRTVYLERVSGQPGPAKEQQVTSRFPRATCVYLAPEANSNELPGIGAVIGNLSAPAGTPGDINAALRVLRGEKLGLGVTPPVAAFAPAPPVLSVAPTPGIGVLIDDPGRAPDPDLPPLPPEAKPGRVRLAVFGTFNNEDVLADWQRRVAMQPALRGYVPSLSHVGARTVLSIDGVSPTERAGICFLASSVGYSCSFAEAQDLSPAVESLSLSYPAHFFLSPPEGMSIRIPEIEQAACDWRLDRSPVLSCPRAPFPISSGVDLLAATGVPAPLVKAVPATRPSVAVQRKAGPSKPSSRSTPRSSSAIASETATKARTDSALIR